MDDDDSDFEDDSSRVVVGPDGSVYFGVNETGNIIIAISEASTSQDPEKDLPATSDP
ncbi:hypothetical protein HanPI659440_Chr09g0346091 [Helianthus annuus]|nr:hypothetical protein HanPI659440_Chr09g0346091 [Helianthus annuus]